MTDMKCYTCPTGDDICEAKKTNFTAKVSHYKKSFFILQSHVYFLRLVRMRKKVLKQNLNVSRRKKLEKSSEDVQLIKEIKRIALKK